MRSVHPRMRTTGECRILPYRMDDRLCSPLVFLTERVEVRLDEQTKRLLQQAAADEERSESAIIRRALRLYLKQEGGTP